MTTDELRTKAARGVACRKAQDPVASDGKHYWNCWTSNYQPDRDGYCIHAFCEEEKTGRTLCGVVDREGGGVSFPSDGRPSCRRCYRIMVKRGVIVPDPVVPKHTFSTEEIVARERAREREWRPFAKPYIQGFADSRGAGIRHGPVHLFDSAQTTVDANGYCTVPLCGRRVVLWNFEGETNSDFCPRCIVVAKKAVEASGALLQP